MENVLSFFTTKHRKQKTLQKVHKKVIRGYTYMDYALLTPTSNIQTQRVMFPKSTCRFGQLNTLSLRFQRVASAKLFLGADKAIGYPSAGKVFAHKHWVE